MLLALLALALGVRVLAAARVELIPEEAYYWMYAQHPSLSYFDHPPMVAWMIGSGTALLGDTELGVRALGMILMLGTSGLLYWLGRLWFTRSAGLVAALLVQAVPVFFGTGLVATMDPALLFFWALALVGLGHALRRGDSRGWYIAGAALGAAVLSKYTAVFLLAGTGLALLARRPWRRHLATVHPWAALGLAALLFSPVILWNRANDWASFRFQFLDRSSDATWGIAHLAEFGLHQLSVLTPPLLPVALWALGLLARSARHLRSSRTVFVLALSLPLLAAIAFRPVQAGPHLNWTLPAYLVVLPAMAQAFFARVRLARGVPWRWARLIRHTALGCLVVDLAALLFLLVAQPLLQWVPRVGHWRELATIVEEHEDRLESETGRELLVVADGRSDIASELAFYRLPIEDSARSSDWTTSQWVLGRDGRGFPYWQDREELTGVDCIYVGEGADDNSRRRLEKLFASVEFIDDPRLAGLGGYHYWIAVGRNLRAPRARPGAG